MLEIIGIVVAALALLGLGALVGRRASYRRARLELEETIDQSRTALGLSVKATAATLNEAREHKDRADRYFKSIERIEAERTEWQRLYHQQSRSHSVAQGMMLTEIHRLVKRLNAYEEAAEKEQKTDVAPVLGEVYDAFREEFVEPGSAHAKLLAARASDPEEREKVG